MISLLYFDSPRINRQVNVASHFRALGILAGNTGMPIGSKVAPAADSVRRELQANRATVLYLLGHSEGKGGMIAGGSPALNGQTLATWLPRRVERVPRIILFNTCDGVASGLVEASLKAGVQTVVAAAGIIPIAVMCPYAETLFRIWINEDVPLAEAVQQTNTTFAKAGFRFDVFGDPSVTINSLSHSTTP